MLETVNLTCNGLKSRTLVKVQKFNHSPRTPVLNKHSVFMYNICPRVMRNIPFSEGLFSWSHSSKKTTLKIRILFDSKKEVFPLLKTLFSRKKGSGKLSSTVCQHV